MSAAPGRKPRTHEHCAKFISDPVAREAFTALMVEADKLHTRATTLRIEAWAIYHARDDEFTRYA